MNLAKIACNPDPSLTDPQPTTLAVKIYEQLRRDIRNSSLEPGQPLRTEWLKAHYQTRVSPSREALGPAGCRILRYCRVETRLQGLGDIGMRL